MGCFPDGMRSTSDAWSPKTGEVFLIGPVPDQAHRGLKTRWCSGLDQDFFIFLVSVIIGTRRESKCLQYEGLSLFC